MIGLPTSSSISSWASHIWHTWLKTGNSLKVTWYWQYAENKHGVAFVPGTVSPFGQHLSDITTGTWKGPEASVLQHLGYTFRYRCVCCWNCCVFYSRIICEAFVVGSVMRHVSISLQAKSNQHFAQMVDRSQWFGHTFCSGICFVASDSRRSNLRRSSEGYFKKSQTCFRNMCWCPCSVSAVPLWATEENILRLSVLLQFYLRVARIFQFTMGKFCTRDMYIKCLGYIALEPLTQNNHTMIARHFRNSLTQL